MIAREHQQALVQLRALEPSFDDCGRICRETRRRTKELCETCDVRRIDDDFKARCREEQKEIENGAKFDFESVLSDYYGMCQSVNTAPENATRETWTILQSRCAEIIRAERHRLRRIDDWNAEQERLAQKNR